MIDYGLFDFSAPPKTGVRWFIRASQLSGMGPGFREHAHSGFGPRSSDKIGVSLVRHPADWLQSVYAFLISENCSHRQLGRFSLLDRSSFDRWVTEYLHDDKVLVSEVFSQYEADVVMRLEDMPWAFLEFAKSIGVDPILLEAVEKLPEQNGEELPKWNPNLRMRVMDKESYIGERYEYD